MQLSYIHSLAHIQISNKRKNNKTSRPNSNKKKRQQENEKCLQLAAHTQSCIFFLFSGEKHIFFTLFDRETEGISFKMHEYLIIAFEKATKTFDSFQSIALDNSMLESR